MDQLYLTMMITGMTSINLGKSKITAHKQMNSTGAQLTETTT